MLLIIRPIVNRKKKKKQFEFKKKKIFGTDTVAQEGHKRVSVDFPVMSVLAKSLASNALQPYYIMANNNIG